jgi:ABC-type transporter Mla subunit MlaD
MEENKSWSELSDDLEDVAKKIKGKISQEELVNDLKESLSNTINSTTELIKNIVESIESTVKDDEFKKETKDLFTNISEELKTTVINLGTKIKNLNPSKSSSEEE